jgi:NADH-quinone oxidoreductase subunit J
VGALIGLVLLAELVLVAGAWTVVPEVNATAAAPIPPVEEVTNTTALGQVIYTHYVLAFQASGIVLLIAMIGAIVLTLRHRPDVKRQSIEAQNLRRPEDVVEVVKVTRGGGV